MTTNPTDALSKAIERKVPPVEDPIKEIRWLEGELEAMVPNGLKTFGLVRGQAFEYIKSRMLFIAEALSAQPHEGQPSADNIELENTRNYLQIIEEDLGNSEGVRSVARTALMLLPKALKETAKEDEGLPATSGEQVEINKPDSAKVLKEIEAKVEAASLDPHHLPAFGMAIFTPNELTILSLALTDILAIIREAQKDAT